MGKKYSLQEIINDVIAEKNEKGKAKSNVNDNVEAERRWLRRSFDKLMYNLGCDKEVIKDGGRNIEFDELEVPVIKVLISCFFKEESVISKFVNETNSKKRTASEDVYHFLVELKKEVEKDETVDKENMAYILQYLANIFLYSPLRSIENCHKLIDELVQHLQDLPSDEQSIYLGKVEHILKKEVALRIAESAQEIVRITERKEYREHFYYEKDPEIQFLYRERDRQVLRAIQEDDDLRLYIEKKVGCKAEKIFNYAALNK